MALRVLLADESSTIKKVMQLALQDFGVEVKAVPIGVDVVQVAKSFEPDIIFADILLAKMNGYEVSKATKSDSMLKHIPVVLMWSSFMELDETKARESKADHRLEKPFDADALRTIVKNLVPATQDNVISQFLTFPDLPAIIESEKPAKKDNVLFDLEEPEEFQAVPLPKNKGGTKKSPASAKDDWNHQDLSKYKIDLGASAADMGENQFRYDEADLTNTSIALSSGIEDISLDQIGEEPVAPTPQKKTVSSTSVRRATSLGSSVDPLHAEEILRQEARKVLETIAWKMIPDVVERVVREELQKLLKDAERL
jgi:CheY-like chemotaxis protein